jgi:hypothetical protein
MDFVAQQGKQTRLARAVGTGDTYLLPGVNLETGVIKQQPGTTAQANIDKLQHGDSLTACTPAAQHLRLATSLENIPPDG